MYQSNRFIFNPSNLVIKSFSSLLFSTHVIAALTCVVREQISRNLAQSSQLYLAQMWEDLPEKQSYHLRDTMASESYKLQINNSCVTSVTRKSTMEWGGLKHALESLILNFDSSIKKTFAWTLKRPCAWRLSTKIACKKVSFTTIGWTNQQRTTHPEEKNSTHYP